MAFDLFAKPRHRGFEIVRALPPGRMNVLHFNLHANKVLDLRDNSSDLGVHSLSAMCTVISTSEKLAY